MILYFYQISIWKFLHIDILLQLYHCQFWLLLFLKSTNICGVGCQVLWADVRKRDSWARGIQKKEKCTNYSIISKIKGKKILNTMHSYMELSELITALFCKCENERDMRKFSSMVLYTGSVWDTCPALIRSGSKSLPSSSSTFNMTNKNDQTHTNKHKLE